MDSAQRIVDCLNFAIAKTRLPERDDNDLRHIIGLGMVEAIEYLYPNGEIQRSDYPRLATAYREAFMGGEVSPSPLFEGVPELLESLIESGYTVGSQRVKVARGWIIFWMKWAWGNVFTPPKPPMKVPPNPIP